MTPWPFGDMRPLSYDFIMADPNWRFENYSAKGEGKNPTQHYHCDTLDVIKVLPVGQLAAKDCCLWLWATNPMLPQAIEVLRAWGFTYATAGHWSKKTKHGKQGFGTGYILRGAGEPFLIGTMGSPKFASNVRSVIEGTLRENSRKPDVAYHWAERLCPRALRRADLFSRQVRPNWEAWGDEINKFEVAA